MNAPCAWAFLLAGLCFVPAPSQGADVVVYRNDFNASLGTRYPEWTASRIAYESRFQPPGSGTIDAPSIVNVESPNKARRFLGEFGGPRIDPTARTRVRQSVRLTLNDLPPHSAGKAEFDLLVLRSWDGSSPQYGPDRFALRVVDGPVLIDTTFSNNPKVDSDKSFQDYPRRGSQPRSGAAGVKQLAVDGFFGDSTYHLEFAFQHQASTLALEFSSDLFEGKGTADESWGLDDVRVVLSTSELGNSAAPDKGKSARKTGG